MRSKARILNHPIHPMLITLPLGLWVFSFIGDILYLSGFNEQWRIVSAYCMAGAVISALVAAVPGLIDFTIIRNPQVKMVAIWHMAFNVSVVLIYAINFLLRYQRDYEMRGLPFILSVIAMIFLSISGWLGGSLAYEHRVGVIEPHEE